MNHDTNTFIAAVDAAFPQAAVFVVDAHQTVRAWSPGAERMLGAKAADVVGEHCRKSNRCQSCMVGCGLREYRSIDGARLVLYREDGSTVAVRKYARAFASDDGVFRGGVEVLVPDDAPNSALPIFNAINNAETGGIVTHDPAMRRLLTMVESVAKTDVTVLVRGESGTGKELVAKLVHDASPRKDGPFVVVNCAAIAESLIESELFGHEKGAFTGAIATHHGYFERANGGTIFLDEVAELPLAVQAKLLRVLEQRTFFRTGGKKPITVDVRVVSATHRSLREAVRAGRFREDLMYRLRVVPIFIPALRERRADIPSLVDHFVARLNATSKARAINHVAPDAMRALLDWPFPGNIRELKNAVEYAFAVGVGGTLRRDDLPPEFTAPVMHPISQHTTARAGRPPRTPSHDERETIERALRAANGDIGAAARALGMSRATFWRRRRAL